MPVTNPETLATLRSLGCLINDRIDTTAIARLLAEQLETHHVARSMDDVAATEATVGQLATALIGAEAQEFIDILQPLLSGGPTGKVQRALSNGHVLCASRTTILVNIQGETRKTSVGTRFLSGNHEVIERFVLEPRLHRAEKLAETSMALKELVGQRQPEMAPQLETWTEKLNVSWTKAIEA